MRTTELDVVMALWRGERAQLGGAVTDAAAMTIAGEGIAKADGDNLIVLDDFRRARFGGVRAGGR